MRMKIPVPLSYITAQQKKWQKRLTRAADVITPVAPARPRLRGPRPHLTEITGFGTNPGHLRMMEYVPPKGQTKPALMVVLHGCLQTAADFDKGSNWSMLAREGGFVLLYPEQRQSNNPNLCFNWFRPSAVARDRGELMSIRQMIESACVRHGIDRDRIFLQGLSAGGGMASALLATYPDLFAAGQIVAGLPFGSARDAMTALSVMKSGANRTPREWGDLVRAVSPEINWRPTISIWHGTADRVVSTANARATLMQWLDLYGLREEDGEQVSVEGSPARIWSDRSGRPLIEFCLIDGMEHGLPVLKKPRKTPGEGGVPFMIEGQLSAPLHMARTFLASV